MTKNTELNRDLIMAKLSKFYSVKSNIDAVVNSIDGCDKISLRLIDWFVTNYCQKHNNDLYIDYRTQLKAFSKHNFDPFKRRDRIKYYFSHENFIVTTVGQLNFFKWAIENNVLIMVSENKNQIESDMMCGKPKLYDTTTQSKVTCQVKKNVVINFD